MAITLRSDKGLPLTYTELDQNFDELDSRLQAIEIGTALSVNGQKGNVQLTTTEIPEGNNLYFTNARVDARLANISTDSLPEGSNLYYTDARARNALSSGTGISYSNISGQISLNANTSIVSEGTNLYYTNSRVDSRLAASSIAGLGDVNYSGTPGTNYVLTWTGTQWEPQVAPGAQGGEANDGVNLGTGQGIFANKVGVNLRFYSLGSDNSINISSPSSNVITISLNTAIATNSITSVATNGNLSLTPNGTGTVVANNLAVSSLTAGRVPYATVNQVITDSANLLFDGTNLTVPVLSSTATTGTAPFVVNSTTLVANLRSATASIANTVNDAAQPNITSVGNLTIANIDNIQINNNTISSIDTNGNIYLTPSGSGEVVISSLAVSDLVSGRIPYVNSGSTITDSSNLTFSGTVLTVTGNANVTGVQLVGNLRLQNNHIEANDTNGNLILTPNGTGRLGIGTATPATFVDVNGTITSTGLTVNGSTTLGSSSASTISLTGRFGSSLLPSTSGTYDLGSTANKFRAGYFSGNVDLAGQIVSSIGTGTAPLVVTSTTQVANLNVATAGSLINGNSNVTITANANVNISSAGTANVFIVKSTGVNVAGTLDASGVATASRFVSNVAVGTAPFTVTSTTQVANLNVATAGTAGTVTTAAQPNITSVGTLTALAITQPSITAAASAVDASTTWNNASVTFTGMKFNATDTASNAASLLQDLQVGGVSKYSVKKDGNVAASGTIAGTQLISNIATGTAPFVVTSTTQVANLSVATAGTATSATTAGTVTTAAQPNITSVGALTLPAGTASAAPLTLQSGTNLTTAAAGRVEYDGTYFYLTPETTAGRGHVPALQTFRLTANGTAIGPTIADYFGATSSISLVAGSVYEISYHAYLTKNTAGTLVWTLTASSAPTLISAYYVSSPITGIAAGAPVTAYTGSAGATTAAFAASGSVSNNALMSFVIKAQVITNLATNFKLQVTSSAGTVVPTAGSYYTVQRIGSSTGAFV